MGSADLFERFDIAYDSPEAYALTDSSWNLLAIKQLMRALI